MKEKIIRIKNLKDEEREFDFEKIIRRCSDSILGYEGAYKIENGEYVRTDNNDADFYLYLDMETNKRVKIPNIYNDTFREINHILSLNPTVITPDISKEYKARSRKRIKEISNKIITKCSDR